MRSKTLQKFFLLDPLFLIFLLKIFHRFQRVFRSDMLSGQSSTVISWSANHLEVLLALWAGAKVLLEKENQHLHKACTFSYPISSFQSTLHLICFDTALLEQPPLSVMTRCDLPSLWRVSMIVFWTIAKSAVFPIIVLSKNKRYPEFILYGWSFIETQI